MGDKAELDMSDMGLVADDAILLAPEIAAYGALTSLNISNNRLGGYYDDDDAWRSDMTGIKDVAAALTECKYVRECQDSSLLSAPPFLCFAHVRIFRSGR